MTLYNLDTLKNNLHIKQVKDATPVHEMNILYNSNQRNVHSSTLSI